MLWTTVLACFGGQALAASVLKRDFWGLDPNAGHWVRHDDQPERYEDYKRDPEGALWTAHMTWVPAAGSGGETITVHVRPIRRDKIPRNPKRTAVHTGPRMNSSTPLDYDNDDPDTNSTSIQRRSLDFQHGTAVYLERAKIAPQLQIKWCQNNPESWFNQKFIGDPDNPEPVDRAIKLDALRAMRTWVDANPGSFYYPMYRPWAAWEFNDRIDYRRWHKFIAVGTQSGHWTFFEGRIRNSHHFNEFMVGTPDVASCIWKAIRDQVDYPPPPKPPLIPSARGRLECEGQDWVYHEWAWMHWRIRGRESIKLEPGRE